jgi:N-acetylglucosaminyldiphosphoundecaprenol N-acetyl-beta-D-mannosaminyltransferase
MTAGRGQRLRLGSLSFDAVTEAECVAAMFAGLADGRGGRIHTANVDHLRQASLDPALAAFIETSDFVVADGMPIVWASRLAGRPLPARVAGSDLVWPVAEAAAAHGRSLFLTGGAPGTAELAAAALRRRNPDIRIAGTSCPRFDTTSRAQTFDALRQQLQQTRPDIVLVGLPLRLAREVIEWNAPGLPEAWWIGVGVSFSFIAGVLPRAPRWQQRMGLEWVHRLIHEPRRLARRYARDVPTALAVLGTSVRDRWRR